MSQQRNVRQQNELILDEMLSTARAVRSSALPSAVSRFLAANGIDLSLCAVVRVETASYLLSLEHGISAHLVTPEHRIYELELELDESGGEVLQVVAFGDVTDAQNLSKRNPGTGWGWGALAIEAHRRLQSAT